MKSEFSKKKENVVKLLILNICVFEIKKTKSVLIHKKIPFNSRRIRERE